jgi:hypothetical protein
MFAVLAFQHEFGVGSGNSKRLDTSSMQVGNGGVGKFGFCAPCERCFYGLGYTVCDAYLRFVLVWSRQCMLSLTIARSGCNAHSASSLGSCFHCAVKCQTLHYHKKSG